MPRRSRRRGDPERGEQLPLVELGGKPQSETPGRHLDPSANSSDGEHKDFDDGANALWSLYGKEAQAHDEALFKGILAEMDGVPTFAGLFAAVLTSFLVDSLKNLQPDPAQQSVYYHQQSVAMLAQISQQVASIAPQVSVPSTPPPPYPAFQPSGADLQVNNFWLLGLVCSLSVALLATYIQQWVRSYMEVLQKYDHPLERARFRQFFFEGARSTRFVARVVPTLIRLSLILFFIGLVISVYNTNPSLGNVTAVYICLYGLYSLYNTIMSLWEPQSSYQTPFPQPVVSWIQRHVLSYFGGRFLSKELASMDLETRRKRMVMKEPDGRKDRDVRAIQWLINRTAANAETETLALAIPGSFNTEWGQDVWKKVSSQAHDKLEPPTGPSPAGSQVTLIPHSPHPPEAAAGDTISRSVAYLFETCDHHSYFESEEARHRRMRACVEAAASLVCRLDYRLDWFGEVSKVVSEIGQIEKVNSPTTISDTSFIMRWTCLSLMDIQRILGRNKLRVLAGNAVNGLVRFQTGRGQPDPTGREGAQRVDEYLKTGWERVEDLRRAFEPWTQKRTSEQVEEILLTHEQQISELERIKSKADELAVVDREVSVYQDAMDDATHRLTRQLPGVSFDELTSDTFNTPGTGSAPLTQLIFPGQRLQALARLGLRLREVLDGRVTEGYEEVLDNLKSVDRVSVSLRRPNDLMRRQLWRLQDLHDGGGLGFSIELFFLSLRRLLSISSLDESNSVFYTGTFKVITSHWMEGKESPGTHCILLNIICDLIIPGRGTFSDFSYPESITTMLVDTVGNMLQGYVDPDEDIRSAVREIECADPDSDIRDAVLEIDDVEPIRMDRKELQRKALAAFPRFRNNPGYLEHVVVDPVG
ncbi:hypothetical protein EDB85DRAFT_701285 [Lactarius pseudohatsudake]|nr:hypothetical protein EDB85DRAFT_701285 [Lactarius pseudohatsudake]